MVWDGMVWYGSSMRTQHVYDLKFIALDTDLFGGVGREFRFKLNEILCRFYWTDTDNALASDSA